MTRLRPLRFVALVGVVAVAAAVFYVSVRVQKR
jgi:hypothetical protein